MTIKYRVLLMAVIMIFSMSGCVAGQGGAATSDGTENPVLADGKVDAYRCHGSADIQLENRNDAMFYASWLSGSGALTVTYGPNNAQNQGRRTELRMVTPDGETHSHVWSDDAEGSVRGAGSDAESHGFVTLLIGKDEEGEDRYVVQKRGLDGEVKETIVADGMEGYFQEYVPKCIAVDVDGYVHLSENWVPYKKEGTNYCILSPQGEVVAVRYFEGSSFRMLLTLPDGHVACVSEMADSASGKRRYVAERTIPETGETEQVFAYGENTGSIGDGGFQMVNAFDDDRLVCVNGEGVFLCDRSFENAERIFAWKDNGIPFVLPNEEYYHNVCADGDGTIYVCFDAAWGLRFFVLKPAQENVREIELATYQGDQAFYDAVVEFNKTHPDCRIVIRDDYDMFDNAALLTRMMAGDGPVLVNPMLVSQAGAEKAWEPLDRLYEEAGLWEALNPGAIKLGCVNDVPYYVVTDFYVDTLVTAAGEANWDYNAFLRYVEETGNLKEIVVAGYPWDKTRVALLFDNGRENSFFLDHETGTLKFDTEEFRKMLHLINQYVSEKETFLPGEGLAEGEVLCNQIEIREPADLAYIHERYGDGVRIVGYPGKNGAQNFLRQGLGGMLAVRRGASEEDRKIAFEFVKMLLSYEVQHKMATGKTGISYLSVRKDVLEEQINAVRKGSYAAAGSRPDWDSFLASDPDNEKNGKELCELIDKAVPLPLTGQVDPYDDILAEELSDYFEGTITEDMLIEHLNNRVSLFLKEQ